MTPPTTIGAADMATAAQAVVDRWDTPLWKDVPSTAEYIGRLRAALAAGQATAAQAEAPANMQVTEKMRAAGDCAWMTADRVDSARVFRAMLAAAPAQPAVQQGVAYVLHLIQEAFAEVAMAYPKAFALHKVGLADTAVRKALAAYTPQAADSVQEDAALLQEARNALWQPANVALCERIDAYLDAARKQGCV